MSESDTTVVLFREEADGQEAEYVEIIEDSEERLVVKATFGMVKAVVTALSDSGQASGTGTASGHVVRHADQS